MHIIYYSCCQVTGVLAVCANALYVLHGQNLALCQPLFAVDSHLCQHISCNILIIIAHYCILVITCYLLLIGHYILFHCRLDASISRLSVLRQHCFCVKAA